MKRENGLTIIILANTTNDMDKEKNIIEIEIRIIKKIRL